LEEPPSYAIFILATTEKHKILPTILSRCQVFDFRRIQIADITKHLAQIAAKEGIEAEPQALHVIAQKADGGLRDALSIFDQLVSFTGNQLTYQDVVRNLNVLDHEHYFRMTDSIVQGDTAAALVEFNSILQQGFDGHLFVTGLARHFRDLLIGQDSRTLPLLEVSEDLMARYGEQARTTPREILIQGLDRMALCDTQYKLSKEPRLLVELMLIQLSHTSRPMDNGQPTPRAAAPASVEKKSPDATVATDLPVTVTGTPASMNVASPERPASEVVADAVPTGQAATKASAYVPKLRLAGQVSIKQTAATVEQHPAAQEGSMPIDELPGSGETPSKVINPSLLQKLWRDYAQNCKKQGRNSLHATLAAYEPHVEGPGRISFTIVNDVQENYLREEKPELLGFLRRQIGDPSLDLEVIKERVKVKPRYTPLDRFKLLAEKNPALLALQREVDLDLGQ
jgi:DNA polymerase-3 subunit gamma/tau